VNRVWGRLLPLVIGGLLVALGGGPRPAPLQAAAPGQAAVVVQFGDGNWLARCVTFEGEEISGLELLEQASLEARVDGGTVCSIEGEGCGDPQEPCFCACLPGSGQCLYWSYWFWQDGEWRYSGIGAGQRRLRDGDVDGWAWGSTPPPPPSLAEICDPLRTAAGRPRVAAGCQELGISAPVDGDTDGSGSAEMRVRPLDGTWPEEGQPLARAGQVYSGTAGFLEPADYLVRVTYADPHGVTGSETWTVSTTAGTVADFAFGPAEPWVGQFVVFTDTTRGITPASRLWDFGDGAPGASQGVVSHQYRRPGAYTVTLTLEGTCNFSEAQRQVEIGGWQQYLPLGMRGAAGPGGK